MISKLYNLNRLGQSGDDITLEANAEERAEVARQVDVLEVPAFNARILLKKAGPNRFSLHYALKADVIQACVVSLEPVAAHIVRDFTRELLFTPNLKRPPGKELAKEIVIEPGGEEAPEEIESLHFDLTAPLVEEFLLALDPYPRAPGVEFEPPGSGGDKVESPFAALKELKSPG